MTHGQQRLVFLAHVLLACALLGTPGEAPRLLSAGSLVASLLGLTHALGELRRRRP